MHRRRNAVLRELVTFVLIHYLLWFPALLLLIIAASVALYARYGLPASLCLPALLLAAYLPSFLDGSQFTPAGRPWDAFRLHPMWSYCHDYAQLTVIRTVALPVPAAYVFGWHPHGILILSRLGVYGGLFERLFPGIHIRALGASPIFYYPGSREVSLALGAVDASRAVAHRVLKSGRSIVVYPGGSKEIFSAAVDAAQRVTTMELLAVKGFVRLAVQHGAPLVPVVVFNERDAYTSVHIPQAVRAWCLKRARLPLLCFRGRGCSLMPRKGVKLGIVYGAPLPVPHLPNAPDKHGVDAAADAVVDEMHGKYVAALSALWKEHADRFGYGPEEPLKLV